MKNLFFSLILFNFFFSYAQDYEQEVFEHRSAKDASFLEDDDSPIKNKDSFKGLNYFPVNSEFTVTGKLVKFPGLKMKTFDTSGGIQKTYKVYGELTFNIKNKTFKLPVYQSMVPIKGYENYLFVPFMDHTTGKESYGAGRYLDLTIPEDFENVIVDFNLSYNPYCAYSEGYACPIPDKNSFLDIEVLAGEKLFKDSI